MRAVILLEDIEHASGVQGFVRALEKEDFKDGVQGFLGGVKGILGMAHVA